MRLRLVALLLLASAASFAAEIDGKIPELPAPLTTPARAEAPSLDVPVQLDLFAAPESAAGQAASPQTLPTAAVPASAQASLSAQGALAQASAAPAQGPGPSAAQFSAVVDGHKPLDVMIVTAEAVPFAKTGGLADVTDALSRGLAARGHRVTLVLPNYKNLKKDEMTFTPRATISIPIGQRTETATILHAEKEGVDIWLLDGALFNARDGPYAEKSVLHHDNDERFIALSRGALEAAKAMGKRPDIVHAHDWHSALMGPMVKKLYAGDPAFANTKSVFTIHNIAYQGAYDAATILKAGFGWEEFRWDSMDHWGRFNFMKAGLQHSDALTTVSPTYAREIQTEGYGAGFDGLLRDRAKDLHGILNGIDPKLWSPRTDPAIVRNYGPDDAADGKRESKTAVQMIGGLELDPNAPLFAVASRFDYQKGIDTVVDAAPALVAAGGQLVLSGSGDPNLERQVKELAARYPGRVFHHPFSEVFVHALYAAADFLLMPSRFEPCGLSQLIAQAYGAIPIVTQTGGLADTIVDGQDGLFIEDFMQADFEAAIARAIALHRDPAELARLRRVAMEKDTSWDAPIDRYVALYRSLLAR